MMRVSEIHHKASVTLEMATTKPEEKNTQEAHMDVRKNKT
jgi:hypothetical protein